MKKQGKRLLINILGGVIIGALLIYIGGLIWVYFALWIPLHNSQEISREVDRYIRKYGYEEELRKLNPDVEIRSKEELGM